MSPCSTHFSRWQYRGEYPGGFRGPEGVDAEQVRHCTVVHTIGLRDFEEADQFEPVQFQCVTRSDADVAARRRGGRGAASAVSKL